MGEIFQYDRVNPTTWVYLSSLLSLALFFKFSRFWAMRNVDLLLVILLGPGLLCVKYGLDNATLEGSATITLVGYSWLFVVNGLLLIRMLFDSAMVRRPLLEANLAADALSFLALSLLAFLAANVVKGTPEEADLYAAQRAESLRNREASELEQNTLKTHGPGFTLFFLLPHISTQTLLGEQAELQADGPPTPDNSTSQFSTAQQVTAKVVAIISQLMIVVGLVLVGLQHFENVRMGIAAATLYLLLPYTAMWTGSVTHALPGALLVWAVLCYRRPLAAGALIGALCGTIYYPVSLLPLWGSFYWRRGLRRFAVGVFLSISALVITLVFTSQDAAMFLARLQQMFGARAPRVEGLGGVWAYWNGYYRYPIIALFGGLSLSMVLWPAQKNFGTLLSCSAAMMIGTQFWHAHSGGGISLAWSLPVLLLTVFRPNLEDRVAVEVVAPGRWSRAHRAA